MGFTANRCCSLRKQVSSAPMVSQKAIEKKIKKKVTVTTVQPATSRAVCITAHLRPADWTEVRGTEDGFAADECEGAIDGADSEIRGAVVECSGLVGCCCCCRRSLRDLHWFWLSHKASVMFCSSCCEWCSSSYMRKRGTAVCAL